MITRACVVSGILVFVQLGEAITQLVRDSVLELVLTRPVTYVVTVLIVKQLFIQFGD